MSRGIGGEIAEREMHVARKRNPDVESYNKYGDSDRLVGIEAL